MVGNKTNSKETPVNWSSFSRVTLTVSLLQIYVFLSDLLGVRHLGWKGMKAAISFSVFLRLLPLVLLCYLRSLLATSFWLVRRARISYSGYFSNGFISVRLTAAFIPILLHFSLTRTDFVLTAVFGLQWGVFCR